MDEKFRIYSHDVIGNDGLTYSLRTMLTLEEVTALKAAGVIPKSADEVIGLSSFADIMAAGYELEAHLYHGGRLA